MLANVNRVAMDQGLIGIQASHERSTAWPAQRILTIGMFKTQTALGQPIDIRRLNLRMAIAGQIAIQVITNQKQNVGFVGGICWLRELAESDQQECYQQNARGRMAMHGIGNSW